MTYGLCDKCGKFHNSDVTNCQLFYWKNIDEDEDFTNEIYAFDFEYAAENICEQYFDDCDIDIDTQFEVEITDENKIEIKKYLLFAEMSIEHKYIERF
jgi:hypothetical protein